jgi:hypothetical protein
MNTFSNSFLAASLVIASTTAFAADDMKKDGMAKDGKMGKAMSMQQCKDHMAMSNKAGMKKDDAMMKKDAMCSDMMKKDGMMKKDDAMMKPGAMGSQPMTK